MPFSDVRHQQDALRRIQLALRSERLPHAYLFTGPAGVGKEMLATRLAAVLLCSDPHEGKCPGDCAADPAMPWRDACGRCEDCTLVAAGTHPDLHRVYRKLNKLHPESKVRARKSVDLSIDVIRRFVIQRAGTRPARGRARVFVIVEADRMSAGAQNAMLKTLEEPPDHSYLILLAGSADSLLPTTRSRCHQVAFGPLPTPFVVQHLVERLGTPEPAARYLAELSQGSLGLAVRYAESDLHRRAGEILQAVQAAADDPLGAARQLQDMAKDLTAVVKSWEGEEGDTNAARMAQAMVLVMVSTLLRDVQRAAVGHAPAALPDEPAVKSLAAAGAPRQLGRAIRTLSLTEYQINHNANTSLAFDQVGIAIGKAVSARMSEA